MPGYNDLINRKLNDWKFRHAIRSDMRGLESPWVDPIDAFAGGIASLPKGIFSALIDAAADPFMGFAIEQSLLGDSALAMANKRGLGKATRNIGRMDGGEARSYQLGKLINIAPGELGAGIKDNDGVADYVRKIKETGRVMPIEIDKDGFIVDGEHRYKALMNIGVKDIPVFVGEQMGATGRLVKPYNGIMVDVKIPEFAL